MKPFLRAFLLTLLILSLLIASFAAGYLYHHHLETDRDPFPILAQAHDLLLAHGYFDPPPEPALEYGMIRGMLAAYGDPYTSFAEPAQHELETNSLQGTFGGIGATLANDSLGFYVLYPYPESPASAAGILEGDRLTRVDDLVVTPETPIDIIQAALRGPVREDVRLTIGRPPDFAQTILMVERKEIPLPSVTWHLESAEPRLGIIKINLIAATTRQEVLNAFDDLQSREATAFVLDLRDNAGGLLDAGIDVSRLFLTSGVIIEQQYRGQPVKSYSVDQKGELDEVPIALLVNHNTASAAEIIAGSLQVNHRAILIGAPTYGKDTIQLVFDLTDGSSLHITAAHWWVPGLQQTLSDHGLQPDRLIDPMSESSSDPFIDAAVTYFFGD
jgi:carboxyl-terminal processing protease